jgi:hypothetical protein
VVVDDGGRRGVKRLGHHPVEQLDEAHGRARLVEGLCDLDSDVAADDERVVDVVGRRPLSQGPRVLDGAHRVGLDRLQPLDRRLDRRRAGRQSERVVADRLRLVRPLDDDLSDVGVDVDDVVAGPHVDVEQPLDAFRSQDREVVLDDGVVQVVREPTARVRDVFTPFEHDHLRRLVETPEPRDRTHPAGVSADDDPSAHRLSPLGTAGLATDRAVGSRTRIVRQCSTRRPKMTPPQSGGTGRSDHVGDGAEDHKQNEQDHQRLL